MVVEGKLQNYWCFGLVAFGMVVWSSVLIAQVEMVELCQCLASKVGKCFTVAVVFGIWCYCANQSQDGFPMLDYMCWNKGSWLEDGQ